MNMATQEHEIQAPPETVAGEVEVEGEVEDESLAGYHEDPDDEIPPGWLVVSDGEQLVVPHPEGRTKGDVVAEFFKAKKSKHHAFKLGLYVFDPEVVTTFGWSENIQFPEMEKFDGVQERLEALLQATAELAQNQAILQQAQAQLFQDEMEDGMEELEAAAGGLGAGPSLPPPPVASPGQAAGRKAFRPPGA